MPREKQLNIRLSDVEADRIRRIAEHYGISVSEALRMLIKREDDSLTKNKQ